MEICLCSRPVQCHDTRQLPIRHPVASFLHLTIFQPPPDDSLTHTILHVARPWSRAGVIVQRWQHHKVIWRKEGAVLQRRGFWVEEMERLPAERGGQSIKDQPQTVRGEEERDALISVAVGLTLMAASHRPMPVAGIRFGRIRLFFFSSGA